MLELLRYADETREVILSSKQFDELDKSSKSLEGEGLAQLSELDSRRTYQLMRKQLEAIVTDGSVQAVEYNGIMLADDARDSRSDMAAIALTMVREMPDGDGSPFTFRLKVAATPEDIEMFGDSEPHEVFELLIEAQNLAS